MEFIQYNINSDDLIFYFRTKVMERGEYRGVGFDNQSKVAKSRVSWTSIFSESWNEFQYKERRDED